MFGGGGGGDCRIAHKFGLSGCNRVKREQFAPKEANSSFKSLSFLEEREK